MAESAHPLGYQCEFIDSVPDDFFCKKCSLVARRLTFTSCCGESYCHACIADIQKQDEPCPECGHQNFTTMKPLKYQRQMDCLKVSCNMKGMGCCWSGTLGQLDAHLNPEQNNCQHVDIKCPLHCQKIVPRNKVEQHVTRECVKRDYACQYCDFKASYEVVVDTHWPQCIYFPLQCPNFCGVTCERDVMEDHMGTCRLEEVACEFSGVGCDGRFRRENQEAHANQNNDKHISMTAAVAVKMNQQLKQKLHEQEEKQDKLQQMFQELEQKLEDQEKKFGKKLQELLQEQEQKFHKLLQEQDKKIVELQEKSNQNVETVKNFISLKRTFTMENFSKEKDKNKPDDWKSPAMYIHVCGYKFCIGIDVNGDILHGMVMGVNLWTMQGEYDHQLKWPAQASFTIELLNQHGGENIECTRTNVKWEKPKTAYEYGCRFGRILYGLHLKLADFLDNDTLYFHLTNITLMSCDVCT